MIEVIKHHWRILVDAIRKASEKARDGLIYISFITGYRVFKYNNRCKERIILMTVGELMEKLKDVDSEKIVRVRTKYEGNIEETLDILTLNELYLPDVILEVSRRSELKVTDS